MPPPRRPLAPPPPVDLEPGKADRLPLAPRGVNAHCTQPQMRQQLTYSRMLHRPGITWTPGEDRPGDPASPRPPRHPISRADPPTVALRRNLLRPSGFRGRGRQPRGTRRSASASIAGSRDEDPPFALDPCQEVRVLRLQGRRPRLPHHLDIHSGLKPPHGLPDRVRHVFAQQGGGPAQAGFPVPATRRARRCLAVSRRRTTTSGRFVSCAALASVPKARQWAK